MFSRYSGIILTEEAPYIGYGRTDLSSMLCVCRGKLYPGGECNAERVILAAVPGDGRACLLADLPQTSAGAGTGAENRRSAARERPGRVIEVYIMFKTVRGLVLREVQYK